AGGGGGGWQVFEKPRLPLPLDLFQHVGGRDALERREKLGPVPVRQMVDEPREVGRMQAMERSVGRGYRDVRKLGGDRLEVRPLDESVGKTACDPARRQPAQER